MKNVKKQDTKRLMIDLKKLLEIESKMLETNKKLTAEEIEHLRTQTESGSPLAEFDYGLYFLIEKRDEKAAEEWWSKFFYHANGFALWKASGIFACLGDIYYEWSMKCLRRSASRKFKLSIMMLKSMEEHPYRFPEA